MAVACLSVAIAGVNLSVACLAWAPAAPVAAATGPVDRAGVRALVFRTMLASGVPTDPETGADGSATAAGLAVWTGALERGELALSDLLLRSFTGTRYLLAGEEDAAFIAAVYGAVLDRSPSEVESSDAALALQGAGNRLTFLSEFLRLPEVGALGASLGIAVGSLPADVLAAAAGDGTPPAPILADVIRRLPASGGFAFGHKGAQGTVDLDGRAGRVDFLLDGAMTNQILATSGIDGSRTGDSFYGIDWDASAAAPGTHEVVVLARRADGRALRIDGGTYVVPVLHGLASGDTVPARFDESDVSDGSGGSDGSGRHVFYRIEPEGGLLSFHAVFASSAVSLSAFDAQGEPLAVTLASGKGYASLYVPSETARTVYVEATRTGESDPAVEGEATTFHVSLDADVGRILPRGDVTTLRSAPGSGNASAGTLAKGDVVSIVGDGVDADGETWYLVHTADVDGYAYSGVVDALRFEGRLDDFSLAFADGSPARLWPDFDAETPEYGLAVDPGTSLLDLSLRTREGALVSVDATLLDEQGTPSALASGTSFSLPAGASVLRVRVFSADRTSVHEYRVDILRPPSADGFSATLDGFPADYRSALWRLHVLKPMWSFVPVDTGLPFADFLAGEGYRDRCLVPAGSVPASYVETGSPVYDGKDWKAASDAAIAHFADPRNFLYERDLFQFEELSFVEGTHTAEGVAAILSGSFMENPAVDTDGATVDFSALFVEAGRESGASPFFLATRVIQEMGRGGSPLALGTLPGYEGVFNFYNIGAVPDDSIPDGQRVNGAKYALYGADPDARVLTDEERALLLPWMSRSLSVRGGARFIASAYIAVGQDTPYFQKFDLLPEGGLYKHQYMLNLLAPQNEGRRQYLGYRATALLDTPFVFRIPFFTDMPERPAVDPR